MSAAKRESKVSKQEKILLKQKARSELNEFEENIPVCTEQLRKLLRGEPLLNCPEDDKFLLRFLRARKFDVNKAQNLIHHYYQMRSRNVDLFRDLCPESISFVLEEKIQIVLDQRDSQGRNVFIFRAGKWNPGIVNLDDIFRSNYLFLEEMTRSEETQISGVTAIVDFNGMGFYQARQFTPKHAIRMVQIIQNSFPCRFQEFHMINQPYIFEFLFSVVKPFLSEKIKKRIYFHGWDVNSLHKKVDPVILPDFLGGPVSLDETINKFNRRFLGSNQYYKDIFNYGYMKPEA